MKKERKVVLSVLLVFAMVFSLLISAAAPAEAASKKLKLSSKKVTIKVGKTKTIKVKNATKKAKWSVKSGKGVVTLTKKKKASVVINGKKAGKAVVTAKIGKKTLKCNVTVQAAEDEKTTPSVVPATSTPGAPTQVPTQNPTQVPTQAPSQNPSQPPVESPSQTPDTSEEAVTNVVIDMTKIEKTTFTESPAFINFASQLEDRFDLSYFKELKIGYELEFEGEDTSKLTGGKVALADTEEHLTGFYDDEENFTYNMMPGNESVSIALSGDKATGKAVGINIQPMDADANYSWPETLKSVTITSIEFVAKEGAVYAKPGAATPTPKPTIAPEFESSEFVYEGLDTKWIEDNIDPEKPVVAISFDDGPGSYNEHVDYGMQIQEALKEAGAHATFFYIGQHIERGGDSRQEVVNAHEAGFEVANHSYDSDGLNSASAATIKEKIAKTDALLTEITGYKNFLFRAPNVAYSKTMYAVIEKPFIDVSIWSNDYQDKVDKDAIVKNVVDNLADGGIINMHSVHEKTAQAVPEILAKCKEQGYQVVSVSELFYIKGQKLMTGVMYSKAE